jgi:hypothetical protein
MTFEDERSFTDAPTRADLDLPSTTDPENLIDFCAKTENEKTKKKRRVRVVFDLPFAELGVSPLTAILDCLIWKIMAFKFSQNYQAIVTARLSQNV